MNQPHHPPFYPMVVQQPPASSEEPPARVIAAITFLSHLTAKTSSKCAVNDISIEWHDGQKLVGHEVEAQMAACNLLTEYFRGKMKFDRFEQRKRIELESGGSVINCPVCYGGASKDTCLICKGAGRTLVTPAFNREG